MAYTLEHDPIDAGHLIAVTGDLDIAATPELSTVLLIAAGSPGALVVLDLAGVEFIDSSALGTLLKAGNEIEAAGKRSAEARQVVRELRAPGRPVVRDVVAP
jgi:anti-anti-sigma factor